MKLVKTYLFISSVFFLALISGLRGGGDPDYINYLDIYNNSINGSSINIEPFYLYLNQLFKVNNIPFVFLILIISMIAVNLKGYSIYKLSNYPFFSLIIYSFTIYLQFDLVAIRQGLALAFIMIAFLYFEKNRIISIFLISFASLFHFAAIIVLPFTFICFKQHKSYLLFVLYIVLVILSLLKIDVPIYTMILNHGFLPNFLINKLETYSSYDQSSALSIKQYIVSFIGIIIYIYYKQNNIIKSMCLLYLYGCIISVLLSSVGDISYRIKWYFFFTEMFFIPIFIMGIYNKLKNENKNQSLLVLFYSSTLIFIFIFYVIPGLNFIESIHERGNYLIF
ncbi:EpsG family protein [Photobacterium leiognathi]|uniref:EpsG family protein n=1 Tax=Photobacterium leiognathi TaxID=553611 RepID=UPI0029819523|nr:EpsG family protein [Photobacterium leiognathi]